MKIVPVQEGEKRCVVVTLFFINSDSLVLVVF